MFKIHCVKFSKNNKNTAFEKNTNYIYLNLGHIGNIPSKFIVIFGTRIICGLLVGKTDAWSPS